MSQKTYKALFFDADKTLLDFVAAEKKGLERVFEKNGIALQTKSAAIIWK